MGKRVATTSVLLLTATLLMRKYQLPTRCKAAAYRCGLFRCYDEKHCPQQDSH
jgi:hypothetical protein